MARKTRSTDVLVTGSDPSAAAVAAILAREGASVTLVPPAEPADPHDRLLAISPRTFDLDPLYKSIKSNLHGTLAYGLRFVGASAGDGATYQSRAGLACVVGRGALRKRLSEKARAEGVTVVEGAAVTVSAAGDDTGVHGSIEGREFTAKLMLLADEPDDEARRALGLPGPWEPGVVKSLYHATLKPGRRYDRESRPAVSMSLDFGPKDTWAWLWPGDGEVTVAVLPNATGTGTAGDTPTAAAAMAKWLAALATHGVHVDGFNPADLCESRLPLAGALERDVVGKRSLLLGPAGGFCTGFAEEAYPSLWSAVIAAQAARQALKGGNVQDALQGYRQSWGATLGDYLRGPQSNLRLLLPLAYRNPTMLEKLAGAILLGESLVR
jgi:flavin-dependent dehydrogenase